MDVRLNADQTAALEAIKKGQNIFLSGPAGSGKSTLVRAIVAWAAKNYRVCNVTAMTGCAAILLGCKAKTLHSWAGIGLGRDSVDKYVEYIRKSYHALRRWKKVDMLVVDEISMMTPDLFDKLDAIAKQLRRSTRPWGGIQLVLTGDFFQLPPVTKGGLGGRYAFDAEAWKAANLVPVLLNRIERQTDSAFQKVLNEARIGQLSHESIAVLKSRQGLKWKELTIRPTLLFSRNADVDDINDANLSALEKPIRVFEAKTIAEKSTEDPSAEIPTGELLERLVARMDADASYAPRLELCEGCQVMLTFNQDIEKGLVNGSRGVVIGFDPAWGYPVVQFMHGDPVTVEPHTWESNDSPCLKREQIPLRVAYAVTIHKSQGATLDCALVDIGASTFECGQAYVALSRVRDLESLFVHNFKPDRVRADLRVVDFYENLAKAAVVTERADSPQKVPDTPPPTPVLVPIANAEEPVALDVLTSTDPAFAGVHESWIPVLEAWKKDGGQVTLDKVAAARAAAKVHPPAEDVFAALRMPLSAVKVVLLGQDPYHGEDHGKSQAMGLSFSVREGMKMPPSLVNIRKEMAEDLGDTIWLGGYGDLTSWVKQGVLLLNACLTVEDGKANSHAGTGAAGMGWEDLTARLLEAVVRANPRLVFLAWGKFAQNVVKKLSLGSDHLVLEAPHPSPLSAHKGFFGSKPFSKANAHLENPIDWSVVA
jgi:uracil-DNA glycosylase